ncbi:hypothetical protein H257_14453 [Aphanomyces astaci]|uniref:Uncharacterized protein n=1 Tax=Aphanomyces astaci TaxID=112090 RepID=W4FQQ7_APHAT|nr:hypothetical protein H257_14453 [Aphanomyces astaci]ETV69830.1 hypothetical protein H257_14453 [Aphanomyces astaci]|eukprot:XP_009840568.1 hypothetical protein H257_14453 [Aphanomyces astaci]
MSQQTQIWGWDIHIRPVRNADKSKCSADNLGPAADVNAAAAMCFVADIASAVNAGDSRSDAAVDAGMSKQRDRRAFCSHDSWTRFTSTGILGGRYKHRLQCGIEGIVQHQVIYIISLVLQPPSLSKGAKNARKKSANQDAMTASK